MSKVLPSLVSLLSRDSELVDRALVILPTLSLGLAPGALCCDLE